MWRQIGFVVMMNLRSLALRRASSSVIVVGMATVVAVLVALLAMANGFNSVLAGQGRQDRVIVLGSGASAELVSGLTRASAAIIADGDNVRRGADGEPLASPEILLLATLQKAATGKTTSAVLRGIGKRGFAVRPELHLIAGRAFQPALRELIVGRSAQRLYRGLEIGNQIVMRGAKWSIVGTFTTAGDTHESELIGDAEALMSAYHRDVFQSITAVLASGISLNQFAATLKQRPDLRVEVQGEREFNLQQAKSVNSLLSFVVVVVGGFMTVGALFAALNTMYSAVNTRTSEIATLQALGFMPLAVATSVLVEAMLLAALGAALGIALAAVLFSGHVVSSTGSDFGGQVAFDIRISPEVLTSALKIALLTATIGALLPAIRAARMPVIDALRAV